MLIGCRNLALDLSSRIENRFAGRPCFSGLYGLNPKALDFGRTGEPLQVIYQFERIWYFT